MALTGAARPGSERAGQPPNSSFILAFFTSGGTSSTWVDGGSSTLHDEVPRDGEEFLPGPSAVGSACGRPIPNAPYSTRSSPMASTPARMSSSSTPRSTSSRERR